VIEDPSQYQGGPAFTTIYRVLRLARPVKEFGS
jgi:hypothetical protein